MVTLVTKVQQPNFECIVIGVSAGGMAALPKVLAPLPPDFLIPVVVVQHMSPDSNKDFLVQYLDERLSLKVQEACEKEPVATGCVYIAPANYHLLMERDQTFSLSVDARLNYSRPSIDVLFESAADAYGTTLVGVVLTGASADGAKGVKAIKERGGLVIAQDPKTAEAVIMPQAAIATGQVDHILALEKIGHFLQMLPAGQACRSENKPDQRGEKANEAEN